jgi:hypothetical protein
MLTTLSVQQLSKVEESEISDKKEGMIHQGFKGSRGLA